jgi:hypothetical protein
MDMFEYIRLTNADWYTANPIDQMSDEELAPYAQQAGLTVQELRQLAKQPQVTMTCPLCGRPSTHLVRCKGCGGGAWGGEFEMAHGEQARARIRQALKKALEEDGERGNFTAEQIEHAVRQAYQWGGCMVCPECWRHTLPRDAYLTCPLKLLADETLEPAQLPTGLMFVLISSPENEAEAVKSWFLGAWNHWLDFWNTVADPAERQAIAGWRSLILEEFGRKVAKTE